jgi:OmpA family
VGNVGSAFPCRISRRRSFDFDKTDIRADTDKALSQTAGIIREKAKGLVRIEGHSDSKGSDPYNQKLSDRRAKSVRDWLVKNEGLKNVRFQTTGFGAQKPAAPNTQGDGSDDSDCRQKNRRVEIVIGNNDPFVTLDCRGPQMEISHRVLGWAKKSLSAALFVLALQILAPGSGKAQQAGWSGSAGMSSGCVGWNCDGKNPCTGMGCDSNSSTKETKAGSTKTTGSGSGESRPTKDARTSKGASKGLPAKTANSLPDMETLTGKSKTDGWGGERNDESRTKDQSYQPEAKKAVDDLQRVINGGKPPQEGWGGGLKSDSRTIEQKLDTP